MWFLALPASFDFASLSFQVPMEALSWKPSATLTKTREIINVIGFVFMVLTPVKRKLFERKFAAHSMPVAAGLQSKVRLQSTLQTIWVDGALAQRIACMYPSRPSEYITPFSTINEGGYLFPFLSSQTCANVVVDKA